MMFPSQRVVRRRARGITKGSLIFACMGLAACLFETRPALPIGRNPEWKLAYHLRTGPKGVSQCLIGVRIHHHPSGPLIFQAPRYSSDNPALPVAGLSGQDIRAFDSAGSVLPVHDTTLVNSELDGNFLVVPQAADSLEYAVDLAPQDSTRFGLPIPQTAVGVDVFDGAYIFLLPKVSDQIAGQWRDPVDIQLLVEPGPGRLWSGTDGELTFKSNYELMFLRGAFDPLDARSFSFRNHRVTLYATSTEGLDMTRLEAMVRASLAIVEDSLSPLSRRNYFVGESPVFWGIEGVQGYWFKPEALSLPFVHIHEMAHTFVGVESGDYDDPWWKEGVTEYLGDMLSRQAGLISDSMLQARLLPMQDSVWAVKNFALASQSVRKHLFTPMDTAYQPVADPEGFGALVYGKGAQAAMIIDRYVLEYSQGKRSLYDLIRYLKARPEAGFHRVDLVMALNRLTGTDGGPFLSALLDQAGSLPGDSLRNTYTAIHRLGRLPENPAAWAIPEVCGDAPKTGSGLCKSAGVGDAAPRLGGKR